MRSSAIKVVRKRSCSPEAVEQPVVSPVARTTELSHPAYASPAVSTIERTVK